MGPHPSYLLLTCLLLTFKLETISSQRSFRRTPTFLTPPEVREGVTPPPELWFTQILDHFNPTDSRMWEQKYFINDNFYEDGGPIFLMIGGEGPASAKWMVNGSWIDYAMKYKALLVQLEHRFYGDSHPTQDLSKENLRYLSSDQALADLAYFITKFKEERNLKANKVIAFGGSHAGSLATWVRLKYPHLVHGSVASSASILAKINYKEYYEVVASSIVSKGSELCLEEIIKAIKSVTNQPKSEKGPERIEKILRITLPIDYRSSNGASYYLRRFMNIISHTVQYNKDIRDPKQFTIGTLCNIMTNESYGSPLERLLAVIEVPRSSPIPVDLWEYQTCTEIGSFHTTDSPNQPFGTIFPLSYFLDNCKNHFGINEQVIQRGVERTNIMYGGKNPKVTRVVFINGSIDPWHRLGVLQNLNEEAPAIFINGTSHCADMNSPDPRDSVQLTNARLQIQDLIGKWLQD